MLEDNVDIRMDQFSVRNVSLERNIVVGIIPETFSDNIFLRLQFEF